MEVFILRKKITLSLNEDVYELLKVMAKDFNLKNNHQNSSNTSEYNYNFIVEESIKNLYSTYKEVKNNDNPLDKLNNEHFIRKTLDSMKIKIAVPRGKAISDIVKICSENSDIKIKCRQCEKWQDINKILKDCPKNRKIDWKYFRNCCKTHKDD